MKRFWTLALLLVLLAVGARGEGWVVDDSIEDDFGEIDLTKMLDLSFVGDCSIGGLPSAKGREGTYTRVVDEKGFDWPFSLVRSFLEKDDLTFANNEVAFTDSTRYQDKRTVLGAPPAYAKVYLHSGIDILNTANNHCMDYFSKGYEDTVKTLDDLDIPSFGTLYPGAKNERNRLDVREVKGVKIGSVGFSYPQESDIPLLVSRIEKLKKSGCDLVIVSLHWGRELTDTPRSWQFAMARQIIDAGADVIWGHHPHILQQVMLYKGKPIFFSTGNFTFGAMMSNVDPDTGIFQLRYEIKADGPHLSRLAVIPCRTQGRGDFRPYPLTDPQEKQTMLKKLIYPHDVEGMQRLPASFVEMGVVSLRDGYVP